MGCWIPCYVIPSFILCRVIPSFYSLLWSCESDIHKLCSTLYSMCIAYMLRYGTIFPTHKLFSIIHIHIHLLWVTSIIVSLSGPISSWPLHLMSPLLEVLVILTWHYKGDHMLRSWSTDTWYWSRVIFGGRCTTISLNIVTMWHF